MTEQRGVVVSQQLLALVLALVLLGSLLYWWQTESEETKKTLDEADACGTHDGICMTCGSENQISLADCPSSMDCCTLSDVKDDQGLPDDVSMDTFTAYIEDCQPDGESAATCDHAYQYLVATVLHNDYSILFKSDGTVTFRKGGSSFGDTTIDGLEIVNASYGAATEPDDVDSANVTVEMTGSVPYGTVNFERDSLIRDIAYWFTGTADTYRGLPFIGIEATSDKVMIMFDDS